VKSNLSHLSRGLLLVAGMVVLATCQSDQGALVDPAIAGMDALPESAGMVISTIADYSSGTVNYFKLDDFDNSTFALSETSEPLAIVDYGPRGELPVEIKRPSISVVFSQPMVPLARLGAPATTSDILAVTPDVTGIYRWYGSRVLAFEPDEHLVSQREFVVTVDAAAASLGGKELGEDFEFTFRTEYLGIASFYPGAPEINEYVNPNDVPLEAARSVTISFTFPVNLDHVSRFLSVTARSTQYEFSARRPDNSDGIFDPAFVDRTVVLELDSTPPPDTDVVVTLAAGAASEDGFLGTPEPETRTYHTITPFRFVDYSTYSWSFPRSDQPDSNPVFLEFSHPVNAEEIHLFVSTDLDTEISGENVEVWGNTVRINNLPVQYETTYRLRVDGALRDIFGRELVATRVVEIEVPAAASYSYFPNTGSRMLESQFPPRIVWEYQNVFDGDWKAASITDPYRSFGASELVPYDFEGSLENVKQYEILDLDPWLNDSGFGWVGLSWNFSERDSSGQRREWYQRDLQVQVTDLGLTVRYGFNRLLVWVHSLSTNDPVADARVEVLRQNIPISVPSGSLGGTTDNDGFLSIDLEPGEYRAYFRDDWRDRIRFAVTNGDDRIVFSPNGSHNVYSFGIYNAGAPISIETPRMETFMFTDRGLYRPGETVTFRGIDRIWSAGEYTSYQGPYSLQVREQTYRAEPFLEQRGRTTATGGFHGSFELSNDLAPGIYAIDYERGGSRKSLTFQIANFRRLSFQVNVKEPPREFFLGDRLAFPVEATYLAGGGLSRAQYSYFWAKLPTTFSPPGTKWDQFAFGPNEYG